MKIKYKTDIVFVILHYKTHDDTIDCIESIFNYIDTDSFKIIVVDNASNNGSFEILKEKYGSNDKVLLMGNSENLGFARGLNVGIKYASENFSPKFTAAVNNDTILLDKDFFKLLSEKYNEYNFAVLGPMMITRDGRCDVNPIRNTLRSRQEVNKSIKHYEKLLFLRKIHLLSLYNFIKSKRSGTRCVNKLFLKDQTNVKLHGAFWVFSEKYFEVFKGLDESTFIYGEEDILYLHCMKNNLHILYTPNIKIYHKEDSATDKSFLSKADKVKFVSENCIKSLKIYLDLCNKYGI